tara:strand:- start:704 stop:889 length:186 start_codon:yes stop_codon:yes gene_type:complete
MDKETVKEIGNAFATMTFVLGTMQYLITTFHNDSIGKEVNDLNKKLVELNKKIQSELVQYE